MTDEYKDLDRSSKEALALFNEAREAKKKGLYKLGINAAPMRVRLASDIDLNRAKKSCKRCHGTGIVGERIVEEHRIPIICRCVVRRGGVKKDAWDKIQEKLEAQEEKTSEPLN